MEIGDLIEYSDLFHRLHFLGTQHSVTVFVEVFTEIGPKTLVRKMEHIEGHRIRICLCLSRIGGFIPLDQLFIRTSDQIHTPVKPQINDLGIIADIQLGEIIIIDRQDLQFRIRAYIQGSQIILFTPQISKSIVALQGQLRHPVNTTEQGHHIRIPAHIQTRYHVPPALQSRQFPVIGRIQDCQSVLIAGDNGQHRIFADVQGCQGIIGTLQLRKKDIGAYVQSVQPVITAVQARQQRKILDPLQIPDHFPGNIQTLHNFHFVSSKLLISVRIDILKYIFPEPVVGEVILINPDPIRI